MDQIYNNNKETYCDVYSSLFLSLFVDCVCICIQAYRLPSFVGLSQISRSDRGGRPVSIPGGMGYSYAGSLQ